MHLAPETVSLKNGKTAFLRSAEPGDAAAMIDYLKAAAGETPFLLRYPDEVVLTEEDERRFLQGRLNDPSGILLNAWMDGALAANCALMSKGRQRKLRHRAEIAIAVRKSCWGLGLGSALLNRVLTLAKALGYEQLELEVIDGNDRALRLYERLGFVQTGRTPRAFRYDDGSYRDEIQMVLRL
ncbi:MAG: GNAT family N-acetyltransferase [Candidatus Limiplasma sp.]|nr:GNAT family N-acetyltransferase [Clostridiales bacterium]MDY3244889.1 GNAT family N-acetyltransferase [Candidatus Limiplasma sp.]